MSLWILCIIGLYSSLSEICSVRRKKASACDPDNLVMGSEPTYTGGGNSSIPICRTRTRVQILIYALAAVMYKNSRVVGPLKLTFFPATSISLCLYCCPSCPVQLDPWPLRFESQWTALLLTWTKCWGTCLYRCLSTLTGPSSILVFIGQFL